MMILQEENKEGFTRSIQLLCLDEETMRAARANFARFRMKAVIYGGTYDSDTWLFSDDLCNSSIVFDIDEAEYEAHAAKWIECTYAAYKDYMKAFIALNLGTFVRSTLMKITGVYRKAARLDYDELMELGLDEKIYILELLKLMPDGGQIRDSVIDDLEEFMYKKSYSSVRTLADFKYYLRFDKAIRDFWNSCTESERVYYFPIYMWWVITAILPLRVTEFLLTPYDCISESEGRYYLTIRRTKSKKGRRKVAYKVKEDYEFSRYEIPAYIYDQIRWYQELEIDKSMYVRPAMGTLFLTSANACSSDYLTYGQARRRLHILCAEIMGDPDYPVHLGDTRHLAMINLILSGGSPVICKELAGHESVDMSSHYYGNLSGIVESIVYEKYHGWGMEPVLYGSQRYWLDLPKPSVRVESGWCDSPSMAAGDIDDCLKDFNDSHAIGECRGCRHYYPDNKGLTLSISRELKEAVDRDGRYLMQMINLVRRGLGYQEDIESAILKLHADAEKYSELLKRKYCGGLD